MLETSNKRSLDGKSHNIANHKAGSTVDFWQQISTLAQSRASVDDLVELIIDWSHETTGTAEIVAASEQFHTDYGKVFHDDEFYNTRTTYFFDYFIFERKLRPIAMISETTNGLTPFQLFLGKALANSRCLPQSTLGMLETLAKFRHSLFQIQKVAAKTINVIDLLDSAKFTITAKTNETFRGLDKNIIFQAFVFSFDGRHHLSNGLILHPVKANRLIRRHIKLHTKANLGNSSSILAKLASLQIRHLRHRHVHPKLIYQVV